MRQNESLFCYAGKILRINLSNSEIHTEPTSKYAREWLGSAGIAIKILYDELKGWVTPFDPANKLIFGTGAMIGTICPGANKMTVSTLGPMTGGWATGASDSYVGGQLKYAGYDLIVIEGKAHKPVFLSIEDYSVEICDAMHLWGKTTWETIDILRSEYNDNSLHGVSIGPGGENLVRGACIVHDKGRAFGRCGSGAVMGSKNLKAIVARGTGGIKIADPERLLRIAKELRTKYKSAKCMKPMQKYGTLCILDSKQATCGGNFKNFQELVMPKEFAEAIRPEKTIEKYEIGRVSFPGCPIGCGRILHFTDGPYAGLKTETNQWEVLSGLQMRLAVEEPQFMFKANSYCNELGVDVDLASGTIGWAMECYEKGIINEKDTDGLRLNWGDADVILELVRKIAYREGFGNILAEGCARAAEIIGRDSSYYALDIKGQDLYETCRGANAWCLGVCTSTRGGGHTTGAALVETIPGLDPEKASEIYGVKGIEKAQEYDGKAEMTAFTEALHRVNNCLGICHFNTAWFDLDFMTLDEISDMYSAATGWETTEADLKRITTRQLNLEKAFNLRFTNFDRRHDMPTPRDLSEPIPTGSLAGWKLDESKYNEMLDEYYDLHGWDRETSYPKRQTLVNLDLEYVANDLDKIGKLR